MDSFSFVGFGLVMLCLWVEWASWYDHMQHCMPLWIPQRLACIDNNYATIHPTQLAIQGNGAYAWVIWYNLWLSLAHIVSVSECITDCIISIGIRSIHHCKHDLHMHLNQVFSPCCVALRWFVLSWGKYSVNQLHEFALICCSQS